MATDTKKTPLVIFGFDAGDLDLIRRWAGEGRLPAIASILERGCWGKTTGPEHVCEHGSWLAAFSGVPRSRHGYYCYRQLKPGTYDLINRFPHEARALPFWSRLRGTGKKVALIDAPEVLPLPGVSGIQLSNWASHQPDVTALGPSAEPADLLRVARRVFGPPTNISEYNTRSSLREDRQVYRRLLERVHKRGALCRHLLAQDRFDLIVIGLYEAHKASHRFWDYLPDSRNNDSARQDDALGRAIRDIYEATDREIGRVLGQLPPDANVVLLSLYGMKDEYPTSGLIESFFRELGYQAPPGPAAAPSSPGPLALVRRALPEPLRVAISHRLPKPVQERLLADQFRGGADWQKTAAFAIPALFTSFLRVNLRGREPQGVVEPGAAYTALLDRLETDLKLLVDPLTGEPAVQSVARTIDMYPPDPPAALPDLFVEWTPHRHLRRTLVHPRAVLTQNVPGYLRSNEHSHYGLFAAAGPSVACRGPIGDVSLRDLAPTFLSLLGEPAGPDLEGEALGEVIHGRVHA